MRRTTLVYLGVLVLGGGILTLTVGEDAPLDPLFFLRGDRMALMQLDREAGGPIRDSYEESADSPASPTEAPVGVDPVLSDPLAPAPPPGETRLSLGLPLDCQPGATCFISKYVDMVPGAPYGDYRCGSLSGTASRGTNFRVLSYRDMEAGVAVLAAEEGIVQFVRDGMPDVSANLVGRESVERLGLGNAILLRHAGGNLLTGYAHLRRGSIRVQEGDLVRKGQPIALVGLSGLTESPQLYFELIADGRHIDPFSGFPVETGCDREAQQSWWDPPTQAALAYFPALVVRIGFAPVELNRDAMEYMLYDTDAVIARGEPQVFMHVYVLGLKRNDQVRLRITGPDGRVFTDRTAVQSEDAGVRLFRAAAELGGAELPAGGYFGQFTLTRIDPANPEGKVLFDVERAFEIR
jgi:hypothetical protein